MSSINIVAQANAVLGALYESCSNSNRHVFGGSMLSCNDDDIIATTISHRILKKFQRPDPRSEKRLKKACNAQWVEFEEQLRGYSFDCQEMKDKSVIYRARALLHKWFRNWKPSNTVEFTPGETFNPMEGKTSVYQKLNEKSNWCVTHDAADDFISLCYRNLSLKRCAKKFMHTLSKEQSRRIYRVFKNHPCPGYAIFHFRMMTEVITLVHGSRSSSVYKNNEERRFINVEALGNMILQRADALSFREVLALVGNSLDDGQLRHRRMITSASVATVDFSKASDSTIRSIVRLMFPKSVFDTLDRHRSPYVLIDGVYYEPVKMSSMGNGFTFELMSSLLLAIARTLDDSASVYGDDVIIQNHAAQQFVSAAQAIGYKVNEKKTFINSRFRESCGAFYLDGHGYITCYDIKWCQNANDVITSCNKLDAIIRDYPGVADSFRDAHAALLTLLPVYFKGPRPSFTSYDHREFPLYAIDDGYMRKHMRNRKARAFHSLMRDKLGSAFDHLCYDYNDIVYVRQPIYVNILASPPDRDLPDSSAKYASYLYSGMVAKDAIRYSGKWVNKLHAVTPSALSLPVKILLAG